MPMASEPASLRSRLARLWRRASTSARDAATPTRDAAMSTRDTQRPARGTTTSPASAAHQRAATGYPGDFTGTPTLDYAPKPDGEPDPGEIVWTWVPYEEDHRQGKDRPVLVIGRDGAWLLALMLTSKDHDRDHEQEARHGRYWQDIGSGDWDRQGRPSEVRVDRILRVDSSAVRREGAVLDRDRFDQVAAAVRAAS